MLQHTELSRKNTNIQLGEENNAYTQPIKFKYADASLKKKRGGGGKGNNPNS